jgi:hypothetical protein
MIHVLYFGLWGNRSLNVGSGFGAPTKMVDVPEIITKQLESSQDKVVWIIVPEQQAAFDAAAKQFNWDRFKHFQMPRPVTNANYPTSPRRLNLIVLKGIGK